MLIHASCAARDGIGVLIRGRPGSGKSSLVLRLLRHGFELVADDCVLLDDGAARAPDRLRGLIEVRGLGIYRMPFRDAARVGLVVEAGAGADRIAAPVRCPLTGQPTIRLDLHAVATCDAIALASACLSGSVEEVAGPLARC